MIFHFFNTKHYLGLKFASTNIYSWIVKKQNKFGKMLNTLLLATSTPPAYCAKTFDYQIVRHNFTFKLALVYLKHYPSPSICKKTTLLL